MLVYTNPVLSRHTSMVGRLVVGGMAEKKAIHIVAKTYLLDEKELTTAYKATRKEGATV